MGQICFIAPLYLHSALITKQIVWFNLDINGTILWRPQRFLENKQHKEYEEIEKTPQENDYGVGLGKKKASKNPYLSWKNLLAGVNITCEFHISDVCEVLIQIKKNIQSLLYVSALLR